jgi:predicted DsbA family dithiol-disulfide isomerase
LDRLSNQFPETDIHWRSFELRPRGAPPLPPEYRARIEAARPQLYRTAREQYGLELDVGPFGIDSRPALVGAKYAEAQGRGAAYHRAVFQAYWQQAQDISDLDLLAGLAEQVGLDRAGFLAALDNPAYAAAVDDDIAQAQAYGLNGVPATVFADRYLVSGAQPYAYLEQALRQVLAEAGAEE